MAADAPQPEFTSASKTCRTGTYNGDRASALSRYLQAISGVGRIRDKAV
jgi:hypothetical protein